MVGWTTNVEGKVKLYHYKNCLELQLVNKNMSDIMQHCNNIKQQLNVLYTLKEIYTSQSGHRLFGWILYTTLQYLLTSFISGVGAGGKWSQKNQSLYLIHAECGCFTSDIL